MMMNELAETLAQAGKSTEVLETPDGTRLLLLPYGARVLGLYTPQNDESFYWVNPKLQRGDTARALLDSDEWHNPGGDRTWLAPELDVFFPDYPSTKRYQQPRELDMSDYAVERTAGGLRMARRMTLDLARPGCDVDLELAKWLGPAPNPLRHDTEIAWALEALQYAGYTQRTTLELMDKPDERIRVGIWNLMQLPSGGDLIVPTYARANPQTCFGAIPPEHLTIEDRLLRLAVRFADSHKIALRGSTTCGRAGYVYPQGNEWSLVVRNFFIDPSGEYVDVQQFAPDEFGYAVQFCRVDNELGDFFEVEYHAPALGAPPEPSRADDVSQVWAFRGRREAIEAVSRHLLGASA